MASKVYGLDLLHVALQDQVSFFKTQTKVHIHVYMHDVCQGYIHLCVDSILIPYRSWSSTIGSIGNTFLQVQGSGALEYVPEGMM